MPTPKVVKAFEYNPQTSSLTDKFLGGFCLVLFVVTWISSILSPFIFLWAVLYGYHAIAAFVVIVTLAAYIPWKKGPISQAIRSAISKYSGRYFQSCVLAFEGGSLPDPQQDPPTFYAVHPHGAFSMGWAQLFCHEVMQHVRFCFAPALFVSPFFRLFSRVAGKPGSAAKPDMMSYMKRGESLALPVGGFDGVCVLNSRPNLTFGTHPFFSLSLSRSHAHVDTTRSRLCQEEDRLYSPMPQARFLRTTRLCVRGEGTVLQCARLLSRASGFESLRITRHCILGVSAVSAHAQNVRRRAHRRGCSPCPPPNRRTHQGRREEMA